MRFSWPLVLALSACAPAPEPEPPAPPPTTPEESPANFIESASRWGPEGFDFMAIYQHGGAWLAQLVLVSPSGQEWPAWQIVNDFSFDSGPRFSFGFGVGVGGGGPVHVGVGTGIVFSDPPPDVLRGCVARVRFPGVDRLLDSETGWKVRATFSSRGGPFAALFPIAATDRASQISRIARRLGRQARDRGEKPDAQRVAAGQSLSDPAHKDLFAREFLAGFREPPDPYKILRSGALATRDPVRTSNALIRPGDTVQVVYDPAKDETVITLEQGTVQVTSLYTGEVQDFTRTTSPITVRVTGASVAKD